MAKQIIIAEQHRVAAVFADDQIQELIVAKGTQQVSDIYVGVVENVLPSIDAAFVNIGDSDRNGFIHMGDLGPLKLRRSSGAITELLAPQQKVMVQVMKEPTGNKGPRLTGNISLPGRYLVLMPFGRGVNLSRRISSESERSRLRALAVFIKPAGMGLLMRTEAEGVDEEAIIEDLELLTRQWDSVQQEAESTRPPALLNRDDDFIQRVLRDVYSDDVNRIVVDSHTGLKRVKHHLTGWTSGKIPQGLLIDQHRDSTAILEYFRVNAAIREALKPRVDLPSGGYIIIEPTEALTVVDVNSGSFTRSATSRETVLWTNFEAATEIARQLRLRNLAGVIVVDFIDMEPRRDQLQVLEHFTKELKADKARPQIAQLTELGLVELTRKRQGQNIYELFGRPCPTCNGLGHLAHLPGDVLPEDGSEATEKGIILPGKRLSTLRSSEFRSRRSPRSLDRSGPSRGGPAAPNLDEERDSGSRGRRRRYESGRPDSGRDASRDTSRDPSRSPGGRSENGRSIPAPVIDVSAPPAAEPEVESDSAAPPSREPRRSRRGREPERQAEKVVIEMTQDEQDVYAWLGISPLVLKDTDVEDPQSAIVTVTLPGEAPPEDEMEEDSAQETSGDESGTEIPEEVPNTAKVDQAEKAGSRTIRRRHVITKRAATSAEAADTSTGNSPDESEDSTDGVTAEDSLSPRRRRRRRRSSARRSGD